MVYFFKKGRKKDLHNFCGKKYIRQGYETILVDKGIEYLEEDKPLLTIHSSIQEEYSKIIKSHN